MCQKLDRRVALFVAACFCLGLSIVFFTSPDRRQERADQPSPRTRWSSSTAAERHNWYAWHARLREQASEEVLPAGPNRSRLVFVGDSIFELLLGSALGLQSRGAEEYPSILQETFGSQWPAPLVLAASGDQTQHLLWRLSHGELSPSRRADPHSIFILHIGTNNLGSGHDPDQTVAGINALTNWLLKHSKGKVLLTTLLRRNLQPPLCAPRRNRVPFLALIDKVRARRPGGKATLLLAVSGHHGSCREQRALLISAYPLHSLRPAVSARSFIPSLLTPLCAPAGECRHRQPRSRSWSRPVCTPRRPGQVWRRVCRKRLSLTGADSAQRVEQRSACARGRDIFRDDAGWAVHAPACTQVQMAALLPAHASGGDGCRQGGVTGQYNRAGLRYSYSNYWHIL
jgi:hypothetical protein